MSAIATAAAAQPLNDPLAACLALPVLRFNGFAMLVAMLPLLAATASQTPAGRWLTRGQEEWSTRAA